MEALPDFTQLVFQQLWFVIVLKKRKDSVSKEVPRSMKDHNMLHKKSSLTEPPTWHPSTMATKWLTCAKYHSCFKKNDLKINFSALWRPWISLRMSENQWWEKLKNMCSRIWAWMRSSWSVVNLNIRDMRKFREQFARSSDMETTPGYATTCGCPFLLLFEFSWCDQVLWSHTALKMI